MENWKDKDVVTWGIMLVNIVYFLYLDLTGSSEDVAFMMRHGAMFVPAVLDGEYFRLLIAVFMHFGIQHLVNNMLILLFLEILWKRLWASGGIYCFILPVVWV